MLSEDFDKKMRDAADHHHPTYDEKAWAGMRKLLDKHMPEEKEDRRRFFFILFFFLLLGGGAWFIFGKGTGTAKEDTVASIQQIKATETDQNTVSKDQVSQQNDKPVTATAPVPAEPGSNKAGYNSNDRVIPGAAPVTAKNNPLSRTRTETLSGPVNKKLTNPDQAVTTPGNPVASDPVAKTGQVDNVIAAPKLTNDPPAKTTVAKNAAAAEEDPGPGKNKADVPKTIEKKPEEKQAATKKEKQASKKRNSFFFSISGGPDASFTGNDRIGRMKFLGGAGVGYTIKDKFSLRTGFYSARKLYTSSPDEYHMSPWISTYYPNLQKVEADCKVYEIPLTVSYNFKNTDKHAMFASAGLSSYIMKRETYDYYYKYTPSAPTINRAYTTYNKNEHYFSVLSLSAGYQRNLGKRVSLTAEPYYKLPLKGVGEGKVKLNSGGVLFTLSLKPFGSADKK